MARSGAPHSAETATQWGIEVMDMKRMLVGSLMGGSAGLYPPVRGSNGTGKRRKRKAAAPKRRKTTSKRRSAKPARLVKGSKAAKAYMAKIRRKRGK